MRVLSYDTVYNASCPTDDAAPAPLEDTYRACSALHACSAFMCDEDECVLCANGTRSVGSSMVFEKAYPTFVVPFLILMVDALGMLGLVLLVLAYMRPVPLSRRDLAAKRRDLKRRDLKRRDLKGATRTSRRALHASA